MVWILEFSPSATALGRLLVHAHQFGNSAWFGRLAPANSTLHEAPGFIPARAQDGRRPGDVGLFEHVDGQTLEQGGEPAMRLGPRQAHLADPVGGAVDPRGPGMQPGHEPAAVQVPPGPLLGVVVEAELRPALRARPGPSWGVAGP